MEDLTTPSRHKKESALLNRKEGKNKGFSLSPFLPQGNQYYLCKSPINPVSVAYISPIHNPPKYKQIEQLLIDMCDQHNCHLLKKSSVFNSFCELRANHDEIVNSEQKKTPLKLAEAESTCEGSDLKTGKADLQDVNDKSCRDLTKENARSKIHSNDRLKLIKLEKRSYSDAEERLIRKRKRKSIEQLKLLEEEYKSNSNWNKTVMSEVAKRTGLSEAQVYKWSWDQKKKKIDEKLDN